MLHAMRVVGMTMTARWIGHYAMRGQDRPFTRMLDALPDVPLGRGAKGR